MKIIHCADLHLDSNMTTNLTKEQAKTRKMEILRTFTRMVDFAVRNQVRVIMISGDLFDTRNVSPVIRNQVRDTILQNPKIDFLYLRGNHDDDNFLSRLEEIPENLLLFGKDWVSYKYGDVVIAGLEFPGNEPNPALGALVLDTDHFNIVMLHGQITASGGRNQAQLIPLEQFRNKNVDYLALGHVHEYTFERLDARGHYAYSGCLEGRGFDECDEHGFILLDIDEETRKAEYTFIPMAYRTLYTLFVDVTGVLTTAEAAERMEQVLSQSDYSSRNLVKFVLVGKVDVESEINTDFLQEQFAEYFYYNKVVDNTEVEIDYMEYEKDASLKGEFIRMVMQSELPEEKKSEIIRCGIGALTGEEI